MNNTTQFIIERMDHEERTAFEAGRVGFSHGMNITQAPYEMDSHLFDCWALGFFTARTERALLANKRAT